MSFNKSVFLSAKSCPSTIPNGQLASNCSATVDTSCGYGCNSGYQSKVGVDTIRCQTSTNWSVDPHTLCSSEYTNMYVNYTCFLDKCYVQRKITRCTQSHLVHDFSRNCTVTRGQRRVRSLRGAVVMSLAL